jgi:hypothetical protein
MAIVDGAEDGGSFFAFFSMAAPCAPDQAGLLPGSSQAGGS